MAGRWLEDFASGEVIVSPEAYELTPERIEAYAAEYDPQPIHLDPEAAARGLFGEITASGWHSLSVTMRLMVRSQLFGGGSIVGVSIERLRFLQPVRAGDRLRVQAQVLDTRPSRSNLERGYLVLRITTLRQGDEPVLTQDWTLLVPRRPSAG